MVDAPSEQHLAGQGSQASVAVRNLGEVLGGEAEAPRSPSPAVGDDRGAAERNVYGPVPAAASPEQGASGKDAAAAGPLAPAPSVRKQGNKKLEAPSHARTLSDDWEPASWGKEAEAPPSALPAVATAAKDPLAAAADPLAPAPSVGPRRPQNVEPLEGDPLDLMAGTLGAPRGQPRVAGGVFARRLATPPMSMYSELLQQRLARIWEVLQFPAEEQAAMAEKFGAQGAAW